MGPQAFPHWRAFINACFISLMLLFLGELIFPETAETALGAPNIAVAELFLSLIIFSDISISFIKTKESERAAFLKKNAIKLVAVFPWGAFFSAFALLRLEAQIPLLSQFLVAERSALASRGFRFAVNARGLFRKL